VGPGGGDWGGAARKTGDPKIGGERGKRFSGLDGPAAKGGGGTFFSFLSVVFFLFFFLLKRAQNKNPGAPGKMCEAGGQGGAFRGGG